MVHAREPGMLRCICATAQTFPGEIIIEKSDGAAGTFGARINTERIYVYIYKCKLASSMERNVRTRKTGALFMSEP